MRWLLLVGVVACASTPVFNAAGSHEEAPEIPCADGRGGYVTGWHRCHQSLMCCPDGFSCSNDDFVAYAGENVCRWW